MISSNHPEVDFRNFEIDVFGITYCEVWSKPRDTGSDITLAWPEGVTVGVVSDPAAVPGGWTFENLDHLSEFRIAARSGVPLSWTQLCRVSFRRKSLIAGPEKLDELRAQLVSIGCNCTQKEDYLLARPGKDFERLRETSHLPPEFVLWYDRHAYHEERGELPLRVRVIVGDYNRRKALPEDVQHEIAFTINGNLDFGRFDAAGLFLYVQWDCFVVGELASVFLQKALVHLALSARVAEALIAKQEQYLADEREYLEREALRKQMGAED